MLVSVFFNVKILSSEATWGMGFTNPYSSIFLSSFDGAVLCASLLFLYTKKHIMRWGTLVLPGLWIAGLGVSLLWSPFESLYLLLTLIKLWVLFLFVILLLSSKESTKVLKIILYAIALQALLGLFQFFTQSDLGLHILGEPILNESTAFLSKISLGSQEWIRAYGTFPHPNIFGAVMGFGILLLSASTWFTSKIKSILFALFTIGLVLSFSRSAALATVFAMSFLHFKNGFKKMDFGRRLGLASLALVLGALLLSRGLSLFSDPAFIERITGMKMALSLLWAHPFGLGFTAYTHVLNEVALNPLSPWEYQPVHMIYLLLMAELGLPLFTLISLISLAFLFKNRLTLTTWALLIFISILGFFDHYFVSLESGRMLLALIYIAAFLHVTPKTAEKFHESPPAQP